MSDPTVKELASFIAYMWTATGKDEDVRMCDLFDPEDPIVADVHSYMALAGTDEEQD